MFRSVLRPSTCVRCLVNRIQSQSTDQSICSNLFLIEKNQTINSISDNPGTVFIRKDVQDLLRTITGFDLSRIFRRRENKNLDRIVYKYLTDKQLKEVCRENLGIELI